MHSDFPMRPRAEHNQTRRLERGIRLLAAGCLAVGSLSACEGAPEGPPSLGGTDAAVGTPSAATPSCAFAATPPFTLPAVLGVERPLRATSGRVPCTSGTGSYDFALRDMDGDQREDLVVTRACDDATVGVTSWRVYPNSGDGFGPPVRFALPVLPGAVPLPSGCARESLVDVDGDRRPDILVTALCTDAAIGTTRWLAYRNLGKGFEPTPRSFALPAAPAPGLYVDTEVDAPSCRSFQPAYRFFDLTGDLVPDLVVTQACDDATVGLTHWRVYAGTGDGVAAPVDFALPPGGTFASSVGGAIACRPSFPTPRYTLLDFDGDLTPDLLITGSCTDTTVGDTTWLVYRNDGTSFAQAPLHVPLPIVPRTPAPPFELPSGSVACAGGSRVMTHTLVDVDGDMAPDILFTSACDDSSDGVLYWRVARNQGAGFAAPVPYALPPALGATPDMSVGLGGPLACATLPHRARFAAEPLLGPDLELVATSSCDDASVGSSRWLLFRPSCLPSAGR